MHIPDIIIAIDGYSSTGKSSFAKKIAKEYSFLYLDSGALYRGVTLFAIENGFIADDNTINVPELSKALEGLDLHFGENGTYIGDRCIEKEIRGMAVSSRVSLIATIGFVREAMVALQQQMGRDKGIVMDGRDIGTTVFPDAELKIFVTASAEVRAQRRYDELKAKGEDASYESILENVKERDRIDSGRAISPLRKADDAILLDNSHMTIPEQKAWLLEQFHSIINK